MKYLTLKDRREIERLYGENVSPREIAVAVGVTTATIYREIKRGETGKLNGHYRPAYSAETAEWRIRRSVRNRGRKKAAQNSGKNNRESGAAVSEAEKHSGDMQKKQKNCPF